MKTFIIKIIKNAMDSQAFLFYWQKKKIILKKNTIYFFGGYSERTM